MEDNNKGCKYCNNRYTPIFEDEEGGDVIIRGNKLCIDTFRLCNDCDNNTQFYAEIEINYCPICGRQITNEK